MGLLFGITTSLVASLVLVTVAAGASPSARSAHANGKIAFQSSRRGNLDIYVMKPDGARQRRLTTGRADDCCRPVWSPNGRKIAFARKEHIYVMNVDGSRVRPLTHGQETGSLPDWQPIAASHS